MWLFLRFEQTFKIASEEKKTMCKAQCDKNNNRRLLDQN